jgi:hypothetical protein
MFLLHDYFTDEPVEEFIDDKLLIDWNNSDYAYQETIKRAYAEGAFKSVIFP